MAPGGRVSRGESVVTMAQEVVPGLWWRQLGVMAPSSRSRRAENLAVARWHAMCSKKRRMRLLSLASWATGCSLVLAGLLATGSSRAGTITVTESSITRRMPFRDQAYHPLWINRADCLADDVMTFPLYVTDYAGQGFEVWVGGTSSTCSDLAARAATTATCRQVFVGAPTSTSHTVNISVRSIVRPIKAGDNAPGTVDDCYAQTTTSSPVDVVLWFMFINPSDQGVSGTGQKWATKYDLVGPTPASALGLGIGDTMLKLNWNVSTDTDLTGYQFFCDPIPGREGNNNVIPFDAATEVASEAAPTVGQDAADGANAGPCDPDAGDADDASCLSQDEGGIDAAGGSAGSGGSDGGAGTEGGAGTDGGRIAHLCPTMMLWEGELPDPSYLCGGATDKSATSGRVAGLRNGYTYSIGVAAIDGVGNVGTQSNIACAAPQPIDDFYKLYREAGGEGGGTFCTASGGIGRGVRLFALVIAGAAGVAWGARRRRRRG